MRTQMRELLILSEKAYGENGIHEVSLFFFNGDIWIVLKDKQEIFR